MQNNIKTYTDKEMCKACGGLCCKQNGCVYIPSNFKSMNYSKLKKELLKGDISIDGIPFDLPGNAWTYILLLRARNEDAEIVDLFTSGGPCKMLKEDGCFYDEDQRPSLGLAVKPTKVKGPCEKMYDQDFVFNQWIRHQSTLELLLKDFTGKEIKEYLFDIVPLKLDKFNSKRRNNEPLTAMELVNHCEIVQTIANKYYYTPAEAKQILSNPFIKSW